jgi:hypothetical protein
MNISDITAFFNILSSLTGMFVAIVTVITLVLMYLQLKEMSRQTKSLEKSINAATYQSIIDSERALWDNLEKDDKFLAEFVENITAQANGLNPQTFRNIVALLAFQENLYYQREQGTMPASLWPHWIQYWRRVAKKPMFLKVWPLVHDIFYEPFAKLMDKLIAEEQTKEKITEKGEDLRNPA